MAVRKEMTSEGDYMYTCGRVGPGGAGECWHPHRQEARDHAARRWEYAPFRSEKKITD